MTPTNPTTRNPTEGAATARRSAPATLVTEYQPYKAADPTRPMWLGLGQGVAYDN